MNNKAYKQQVKKPGGSNTIQSDGGKIGLLFLKNG